MSTIVIWTLNLISVCLLAVYLEAKTLKPLQSLNSKRHTERIKRGYSHYGGNDYSSSIQLSSPVLQYSDSSQQHTSSSLAANSHLSSASADVDPWSASGLSPGYEVWLEPSSNVHSSSAFDSSDIHGTSQSFGDYIGSADVISSNLHASTIDLSHPASDYITNSVFSHVEPSSQLHTQISSSSSSNSYGTGISADGIHDHGISTISDNIDFNNVADIKGKHYTKSYGK